MVKYKKYILAIIACSLIFLAWSAFCAFMEFKNSGGILPMLVVMAVMGAAWKGITGEEFSLEKSKKTPDEQKNKEPHN